MIALLSLLALGSVDEVTLTSSYYKFQRDTHAEVQYRFKFQGIGHYQVLLEEWKWVDDEVGQVLRLHETYHLFNVAALSIEGLPEQSHRSGTISLDLLEARGPSGALFLGVDAVLDPGVGAHIPGFQSGGNHLVGVFLPTLVREFRGTFEPRIADGRVEEFVDDWDGANNIIETTKFTLFGNEVHTLGRCGGGIYRTLDLRLRDQLQSRGVVHMGLNGRLLGHCVDLLDKDGKLLLRTKF